MQSDLKPGDPAPEQGKYIELNVFGSATFASRVVWREAGESLPTSARGFTWIQIEKWKEPESQRPV